MLLINGTTKMGLNLLINITLIMKKKERVVILTISQFNFHKHRFFWFKYFS